MSKKVMVGGEWKGEGKLQVGVVQDRVEVEGKVDAREKLPDEAWSYLGATMGCAKSASAEWVFPESKMSRVARKYDAAATCVRQ